MIKNIIKLSFLIAFVVSGCSDGQKLEKVSSKKAAFKDAEVISVNGQVLMKSALRDKIEFILKMNALANPKMSEKESLNLKKSLRGSAREVFIRQVVLSDYLKAEKVEISSEAIEKEQERLLARVRMKKGKFGDLKKKARPYEAQLVEYVRARACEAVARARILEQNPTNLPPTWASEQIARAKAYNERMALTNALVYARATNVWEQLKKGADFKEMAKKYSEVPMEAKDGGEWGQLELQQLEPDDELVEWAQKLKVGEFSPPIQGDNGLMILKIDEMKGADYVFSRVFFRLPMFATILSEEEMLKRKTKQIRTEQVERVYRSLVKKAKIVRPKKKSLKSKQANSETTNKEDKK